MTDDPRPGRQPELDGLTPADAAVAARLRDFGDVAVRPFDAVGIVALATAGQRDGRTRLGGTLRFPVVSSRAAWVFIVALLVVVIATIVVAGSTRVHPSIVEVPSIPPSTAPSDLAVVPSASPIPSPTPGVPGPAVLGPGRITYTIDGNVYVADLDGSGAKKILTGGKAFYDDPRWSADGRISVTQFAGDDQTSALDVDLTDANGTTPDKVGHVVPGQGRDYQRWSPDGTRLAILDRSAITIVGGDGPITLTPPSGERWDVSDVMTLAWSPDGTALLAGACQPEEGGFCPKASNMRLMLVPTDGSPQRELADATTLPWAASFSPDGSHIAIADSEARGFQVQVMDADGTHRRILVPAVTSGSWTYELTYVWSPDGRSIAFHHSVDDANGAVVAADEGLWVKEVGTDEPARHVTSVAGIFDVKEWSPDGRWLLVSRFAGDVPQLSAVDVVTGAETVLARGTQDGDWSWDAASSAASPPPAPSTSPTASSAVSAARLVYLQDKKVVTAAVDGSQPRVIANNAQPPSSDDASLDFDALALSPDGRSVAYTSDAGVDVVSAAGRHLETIPRRAKASGDRIAMTWAPDSVRLAVYRDTDPGRLSIVGSDGHEVGSIPLPEGFVAGRQAVPQFSWAPDGRWIAISGCVDLCPSGPGHLSIDEILLVAADGSGSHWLNDRTVRLDPLPIGGTDAWADWSVGSRLAVSRECRPDDEWCDELGYPKLQITGLDGVGGTQVRNERALGQVDWSPDGQRVAVASWTPGGPSLVIAEPDGSFTSGPGIGGIHGAGQVHWAPDGNSILIAGNRSIWSVPLDGGPASEIVQDVEEWFAVGPAE